MNYQMALITGASSGIGEAFAAQLAAAGTDLTLVARSEDKLRALADRLNREHGRRVEVIPTDLTRPGAAAELAEETQRRGIKVDLLINNAGFGTVGSFHKLDPEREQSEILLNAAAVVDLCHAFLPEMLEQGGGGIVNVASAAAFQPIPFMTVYAASKAFVLSFSQGLWGEYRRKGIRVVCLCPGPVDTPFFEATGVDGLRKTVPRGTMLTAERVVADALKALRRGQLVCVPGYAFKAMALLPRLVPGKLVAAVMAMGMKR